MNASLNVDEPQLLVPTITYDQAVMDLPTVKASVKGWEKAFKASHKRDPTKDDIKRDSSGIGEYSPAETERNKGSADGTAEQYSLYRRLTKATSASQSQNQAGVGRTSSSQVASSSNSQPSRATPRVIAASDFPTTPTPPTRRHSSGRYSEYNADEEEDRDEVSLQAGPSNPSQTVRTLKRTASKAALLQQPTSPAHKLLTTPKKRPYTGPIHDPNPINPFAASPLRRSAIKNGDTSTDTRTQAQSQASPFFHATSPMKLKELLQENSLRKVQERNSPVKEITPRTKARKRLTGEIEETPAKSRVRRKRGAGAGAKSTILAPGLNGLSKAQTNDEPLATDDVEEDDEFGPTPVKSTRKQEGFHPFFEMDNTASVGSSRGPLSRTGSSDMVGRLLAAGGKGKGKAASDTAPKSTDTGQDNAQTESTSPTVLGVPNQVDEEVNAHPEAPWDEDQAVAGPSKSKSIVRPDKTVSISDDELDEWDPEASHVRHHVRIVPTRSRPKKHWSDSDNESIDKPNSDSAGSGEDTPTLDDTATSHTNPSVHSPPQILSLLSLTSPNQRQGRYAKLKELRYKALFNPNGTDARKLKALQKGQEAFVAGEVEDEEAENEDEGVGNIDQEQQGERADDDWESESDGWNRTGVEMDDDAW